ncbi:uncharacterized protein LOC143890746 [Tasmannia lanceolata]|uniref:uncharacterized protein LOC143890746 n=1 Tax=Tasmannia lanceolata TaxID=3420 RepID=UPI004062D52D
MRNLGKGKSSNKYCRFHQDHGHTTDDCYHLKNEIERLAGLGKFDRYLQNPLRNHQRPRSEVHRPDERYRSPNHHAESSRQRASDQEEAPKITRNIDTIYGGPTEEGHALYAEHINSIEKPSKKSKADPSTCVPVTFTDADYGMIYRQHDDTVVVQLTIANCNVERILVDTGSSVNVLHQDAFAKMDISSDRLEPVDWSIYGFSGGEVKVRKNQTPCNIRESPDPTHHHANLCNSLHPFHLQWDHRKASAERTGTTAHLKIKFPTKLGVGEVIGDQEKARECYTALLEKKRPLKKPSP